MTTATAVDHTEGVRNRTVSWTDPARARFQLRGRDGFEQLREVARGTVPPPPVAALLGMKLDRVDRGRVVFSIVADEMHENPMGSVHGGVIATLVDSAMGCAVASMLPAGTAYTTLELKTNYVRAATQATGVLYAEGHVVHLGGRTATTEATVKDEHGTLYAHASSTCLVIRPPSRGRT
jgi:uncharacterized protein (TIGR00369 family)